MSTSSGTLDSSITFFPFGATRTGSVSTDKKFTGQRLDSTGLYYYGARYYDASIGRFISADSVGQKPTDPQSLNRYTYCLNNPLKYTDPTGHDIVPYWQWFQSGNTNPPPPPPPVVTIEHPTFLGFCTGLADFLLDPTGYVAEKGVNTILSPAGVQVDVTPSIIDIESIPEQYRQAYETGYMMADATVQVVVLVAGTVVGIKAGGVAGTAESSITRQVVEKANGKIRGFTLHGLDQALTRDAVGVSNEAMVQTVNKPLNVQLQDNGVIKYIGKDATVIVNSDGLVITTWANNSAGYR